MRYMLCTQLYGTPSQPYYNTLQGALEHRSVTSASFVKPLQWQHCSAHPCSTSPSPWPPSAQRGAPVTRCRTPCWPRGACWGSTCCRWSRLQGPGPGFSEDLTGRGQSTGLVDNWWMSVNAFTFCGLTGSKWKICLSVVPAVSELLLWESAPKMDNSAALNSGSFTRK